VNLVETISTSSKSELITKFDATFETKVAERFNIEGFPTLKFFVNREDIDFNSGRSVKDVVGSIIMRVQEFSAVITHQSEFDSFIKDNQVAMIYFVNSESEANLSAFKSFALSKYKLTFALVFNDEVIINQKTTSGSVVIFKKLYEGRNEYEDSYNFADLKKWINEKSFSSVIVFNDSAIENVV
jgi:protein disulfide-isomerase A1